MELKPEEHIINSLPVYFLFISLKEIFVHAWSDISSV